MTGPIRVLIAHYKPDIVSGAENSIADLVQKMSDQFQCTMLVPGEGKLAEFYRQRGIKVWAEKIYTPRRIYPGRHFASSLLFARKLRKRGFDLVLCNTFAAASRASTASRLAGLPYAIFIREVIPDNATNRAVLDRTDAVFAISKDLVNYLGQMTSPEKIFLTYNHINPKPILQRIAAHKAARVRLLPYPEQNPVIGLIGRISRFKQQDLFIRAIPLVMSKIPEARFVIVGSATREQEKSYEAGLHTLAKSLSLDHALTFMGSRSDNIEITTELTVSCLTSDREPLGRVILEAHLVGCPVVVPDTGGPAEIVEDEVTGLCFSSVAPDSHEQLAAALIRLLKDPLLAQRLADNARERIHQTFAGEVFVHRQEELFEMVSKVRGNGLSQSSVPHGQ